MISELLTFVRESLLELSFLESRDSSFLIADLEFLSLLKAVLGFFDRLGSTGGIFSVSRYLFVKA